MEETVGSSKTQLLPVYPCPGDEGNVYTIQYIMLKSRNINGKSFRETLSIFLALCFPAGSTTFGVGAVKVIDEAGAAACGKPLNARGAVS